LLNAISNSLQKPDLFFKINKLLLLGASYFFYGYWDYRFLSLIVLSSVIAFWAGDRIFLNEDPKRKKRYLIIAILINLIILGLFKYSNFFIESANQVLRSFDLSIAYLNIILPVGISFYTFQAMSYPLDIYFQKTKPTKSFFDLALFIAFFPQLIAGPIVRASHFLPQLLIPKKISIDNFFKGLQIFLFGLFLKIVIADKIGLIIDPIFESPTYYSNLSVWFAILGFTAQVFCDIAGYTEAAIGVALVLGYELPINFKSPYIATDIIDFWQRWHISLSAWFRDYVFSPLQFARFKFLKNVARDSSIRVGFNFMVTMLLIGIWHGPRWTYVLFGFVHGVGIFLSHLLNQNLGTRWTQPRPALKYFKWAATLLFVILAMVLFRAENLTIASQIYAKVLYLQADFINKDIDFSFILSCFIGVTLFQFMLYKKEKDRFIFEHGTVLSYFFIVSMFLLIFLFPANEQRVFIYFQF
jgi:alginate O-acetyltransferase complex protein AlgI